MTGPRGGGSAEFRWGLRKYLWVVVLSAVTFGLVVPIVQFAQADEYEARALVVTQELNLDTATLPRYARAVFNSGAVSRQVAAEVPGVRDASSVDERLSVVVEQDSVVFHVVATDPDAVRASQLANVAAGAFVAELNKPGDGVGRFSLQDPAQVPQAPEAPAPRWTLAVPIGILAGAAFGLGLIALLVAIRRPVSDDALDTSGLSAATKSQVLGTVVLPRSRRRRTLDIDTVPGLPAVARLIAESGARVIALVSLPSAANERMAVSSVLAATLDTAGDVRFLVQPALVEAFTSGHEGHKGHEGGSAVRQGETAEHGLGEFVILDGLDPVEYLHWRSEVGKIVLVVREATPLRKVAELSAQYLERDIYGIVLVRERRLPRSRKRSATPLPPAALNGAAALLPDSGEPSDAEEPERAGRY